MTLSLGSGVGMTCPRAGSRCKISAVRYMASLDFLMSSSVTEEGIHRPGRLDPDIVEGPKRLNLSFGCWNSMQEADSIKIERKRPCPLYKEGEYQASSSWPFGTGLRFRSPTNRRGWVTHVRINGYPVIRGHVCFDKTCQGNRLTKHAETGYKNDSNKDWLWCDVTLRGMSAD